jgi:tocopherol O-methyltransferase
MGDSTTPSRVEASSDIESKQTDAQEVIYKYEIPEPEPFISFNALKERIRHHYELASDYYYSLWYVPRKHSPYLFSGQRLKEKGRTYPSWLFLDSFGHKGEGPGPID